EDILAVAAVRRSGAREATTRNASICNGLEARAEFCAELRPAENFKSESLNPQGEGNVMREERGSVERVVLLLLIAMCCAGRATADSNYSLRSPDNRIEVQVHIAKKISYDVMLNNKLLMK